jgi:hypothetical protein
MTVAEPVIYRDEVVRLLCTLYDMSYSLKDSHDVLVEEDDGEEEDEG